MAEEAATTAAAGSGVVVFSVYDRFLGLGVYFHDICSFRCTFMTFVTFFVFR
jgi:hypothetical protein